MSKSRGSADKSSATTEPTDDYPRVLDSETFDHVPQSWLDAGRDADPAPDERLYVADACHYSHFLRCRGRTATTANFYETRHLLVRYRDPETGDTVERSYLAALVDGEIVPKVFQRGSPELFAASVAVPAEAE
ncbi:hypothetical protein [Halostella litorea]|uniref:hypothetical protein n=1 Tax=Halostella litorea TaxID=2528831 RepID=UPI001091ED0B|nr:hypothetical protein [Halostella litorea]